MTAEFLARTFNGPNARNAGIALQPPIRHDLIAIELHDQTSGALAKGCSCGGATDCCEKNSHREAG